MASTHSGRLLLPTTWGTPTIVDWAVQTGRFPRFAGATSGWWSVLHHSVAAALVAPAIPVRILSLKIREGWSEAGDRALPVFRAKLALGLLLHDVDELPTGDVPTTWKPPELRELQRKFRSRAILDLVDSDVYEANRSAIEAADRALLLVEGELRGPPGVIAGTGLARLRPASMREMGLDDGLLLLARRRVLDLSKSYAGAASSADELDSPLVRDALNLFVFLGRRAGLGGPDYAPAVPDAENPLAGHLRPWIDGEEGR